MSIVTILTISAWVIGILVWSIVLGLSLFTNYKSINLHNDNWYDLPVGILSTIVIFTCILISIIVIVMLGLEIILLALFSIVGVIALIVSLFGWTLYIEDYDD